MLLVGSYEADTAAALQDAGLVPVRPQPGEDPLVAFSRISPDAVVATVDDGTDGFGLLRRLREVRRGRTVPVILITDGDEQETLTGLQLGADDCVSRSISGVELAGRVRAKAERPPVPASLVSRDLRTGLLAESTMVTEAGRELNRSVRTARDGGLALIQIQEMPRLLNRFGGGAATQIATQVTELLGDASALERIGLDHEERLLVLLPETSPNEIDAHLRMLAHRIAGHRFTLGNEDRVRLTPVTGWAGFDRAANGQELLDRAETAMWAAANHLDLRPVRWTSDLESSKSTHAGAGLLSRAVEKVRLPAQFLATLVIGVGVPYAIYALLGALGWDVSGIAYWVVMAALLVTAGTIWLEGFFALDPQRPPDEPGEPYPAATAIIAAYLPNEAATIQSTIEAFQRLDYPGPLQILVAYNTPEPMAIEDDLHAMAQHDPRVVPLKVPNSTSKAQNVNAAMSHVTGEFVGMFDADHHPEPLAFRRAWRWLSNGYDVVQGHCVIRNGDASLVARTVAVEFESIYAVSHPGRTALHGFGIFGGSNGYWRTSLLAETRMHGNMLTEDIDSTLRVLAAGAKIASDPALVSYELAPTNARSLWKQRARWAQGWFQVSRKHLRLTLRSKELNARQKAGFAFLLGWREIYPWLSLQIFPVLAYTAHRDGGVTQLNWLAPSLILATLFTLAVGPAQTLFAWRLAVPELRERKSWFVSYLLVSSLVYTEWKNIIARIAQIKELVGESQWNVTPRDNDPGAETTEPDYSTPSQEASA